MFIKNLNESTIIVNSYYSDSKKFTYKGVVEIKLLICNEKAKSVNTFMYSSMAKMLS